MSSHPTARRLARLGLALAAMLGAGSLVACGPAFDNAMGAAYDKSFHDSCVTAASKNASAAQAEAYCSCVVTQLDKLGVQQRVALQPSSQPVTDAENTCVAQVQGATLDTNATPAPPPSNSGP